MSDKMRQIPFQKLVTWVFDEYGQTKTIFGIPEDKFYRNESGKFITMFGEKLDSPVGPAAGPNTQLAQNIVASYLSGSRFFELKTVQILDKLEFPKPCIRAEDECYNTEWSTELAIEEALAEYVKAWFMLHILQKELFNMDERRFMFNMSVGYDLKGIQSPKVDSFIEGLKNAAATAIFQECKTVLLAEAEAGKFHNVSKEYIEKISANICTSITLSTMHGCPPAEIEAISKYLLTEKKLHTFVKMNPTLLGYRYVRDTFDQMGYTYVELKEESFTHDLQYADGVAMLKRLKAVAQENQRQFGVKLSNTLPTKITRGELPGEEMYMSGRSLYPLTINLALKLAGEFDGDLRISFSGGADFFNIAKIFATGIRPITIATTLLKPGGYTRLKQIASELEGLLDNGESARIDFAKLQELAASAFADRNHRKEKRTGGSRKIERKLPLIDCFAAPCTYGCPIGQDIPEYTRLVGEGRYQEAFAVVVDKNPLPFITGTICNHNCQTKCTRLDYDESVLIRDMKLLAAQNGYDAFMERLNRMAPTSKGKAAVIGAGPSGLAAGYFLARAGLEVTVFDKREQAGGTVEYVIPDFRIGREAIRKDIELIKRMGVKFEFGADSDFSVAQLKEKGYTYVYLAIGAGKTGSVNLEGDGDKVMGAIPFLEAFTRDRNTLKPGKSVAVIGGGNSAMDAARAAKRLPGVENVYIIYRRTKEFMPADREELNLALEDGVVFKELLVPLSLKGGVLKCQKMTLGQPDASGRRSPVAVNGEFETIPVDTVLTATGEQVDYDILRQNGLEVDTAGKIQVNPETLESNLENVFIGGDALYGPSTVVNAIAHAAKAAKAIIAKENQAFGKALAPTIPFDNTQRLLDIVAKKGVLKPAESTISGETEAKRCLECNYVCNVCVEVCPNRANIALEVNGLNNVNQVIHVDGMCNECGNCSTFCPSSGAPYKDKFTLFWSEEDFADSVNSGFLLLEDEAEPVFRIRLDGKVFEAKFGAGGKSEVLEDSMSALVWTAYKSYPYLF
ncbi:putative selenate reductase subunit YgfK [Paradesulfitobacterium ferrireducens]|uniref:putative selenate reductase subunit YgfK n=1 Tax=Paradesulfitobacterium ferrireducens TaxID=2816476 RepID=UPI001A8C56C6|nr:putative selenate reductase subunit YgfK [Paradesulfitobacterium ferrireducens]